MENEKNFMDSLTEMKEKYQNELEKQVPINYESLLQESNEVATVPVSVKRKPKPVTISADSIVERDVMDREKDLKSALYGNKSAFQIVAAQSGYMAKVMPLVHKDAFNLLYSTLSRYEYKKAVYKVIYDKILDVSVGKMSFDEWLKNTTVEDIETFYYGIYCATFPDEGNFSYVCEDCGNPVNYKINNNSLLKTADTAEMKKLIDQVSKNALNREAMSQFSLIGKNETYKLEDSGIVVEIRTPTLWDSLELLRLIPEEVIDKDTRSVTNMLYVDRVLIPVRDQQGKYSPQTDRQEILRLIDSLTVDDAAVLQDVVSDRVENHRISYSIKKVVCPTCKSEITDIPVSIEDILFTLIFEKIR